MSITDPNLDAQLDALKEAGAERVLSETISGATAKRPELQRMLDQLRDGDVVMVALRNFLDIVEAIKGRGAGFRSLAESIDTTTPAGELIFHVFASIAHFLSAAGLRNAPEKALGCCSQAWPHRWPALSPDQKSEVIPMRDEERRPLS